MSKSSVLIEVSRHYLMRASTIGRYRECLMEIASATKWPCRFALCRVIYDYKPDDLTALAKAIVG